MQAPVLRVSVMFRWEDFWRVCRRCVPMACSVVWTSTSACPKAHSALHILFLLGFMALGRIRRPEGLRHIPPREMGKVIGLDRAPEVRTLREKIGLMAANGHIQTWMQDLSKSWMNTDPTEAGYLYIDSHPCV